MKIASCGGLVLDDVTITMIDGIITPVEDKPETPTSFITPNCGGVRFNSEYFQMIKGIITVREAQDVEIEQALVLQKGCGCLRVDGKYFKLDENFGLSVDWDLIPNEPPES